MKRRQFITLLGGAATWPMVARAQHAMPMRRVGVLLYFTKEDLILNAYLTAFQKELLALGWLEGNTTQIDYRWTGGKADLTRQYAAELLGVKPEVILAAGGSQVGPLMQVTRTVPIVFVEVTDAVGAGYVASLAQPRGNATGFTLSEFGMSGKWLELLKQIAPHLTRALVLRDPSNPSGAAQFGAIQAVAPSLGIEVGPVDVRQAGEIERAIMAFAREPNGGLIVSSNAGASLHRELIIELAARHMLPAVYPYRYYVTSGGLTCYGPDLVDQYRRAAGYVDRILKGETPADLPVQAPTKYETVINLKTAKALGLDIPATVLARADEVIE
jgi:putative ABC transport system substrate-binding protein